MNIGIFTNNYLPNPYGVTGSIESFRKQLEKLGHTVYIFAPKYKNYTDENSRACPKQYPAERDFGRVFRYPSIDFKYKISFPLAIPFSKKMDKIISGLDLDIIHSQHPNLLGSAAQKWAKKKNIPLCFTWHTLYDQYTHFIPLIPEKISGAWAIKNATKYANRSDAVIIPTESIRSIIQNWGVTNKNIFAIPTGVEEEFYQNPDRNIVRNKFGIKDNEILLLLVSRLTEEKNVEFLFRSIIKVLETNPTTKLLVSGDGYLLPRLKSLVTENNLNDRIFFEGIVKKEELKNYYSAGDIFVYASKSETQGMIVSEAMYCGLPIVAVASTGIESLVENNQNGFLVSESEEDFSQAVQKLIDNPELRKNFAEKSAQIAQEKYTSAICAKHMLEIYEKVINNKKNGLF
jgi:glycosyltransferase involved in cell wall biosynthesis